MRRLPLALAAAVLGACSGSLFQSKAAPESVYLLSAQAPAQAKTGPAAAAELAVLRPRVRTGLDNDRIALLHPDRRLEYFADARWSGPLDQVIQDLTVQAFHAAGRLRNVSADASAFSSGYWLEIEVADFQAEYDATAAVPTIHVHLLARLGSAADRHLLGTFDASARTPAAANRLTAIVQAYEQAVDAALAEIIEGTVQTCRSGAERPQP